MPPDLVTQAVERLKSGINYVCSECGALLYHTGVDGAYAVGQEASPSKQPAEIADRLTSCPNCGRRLSSQPDLGTIKVQARLE